MIVLSMHRVPTMTCDNHLQWELQRGDISSVALVLMEAVYDLEIWRRRIGKGPVPAGESYHNADIGNGLFREVSVLQ